MVDDGLFYLVLSIAIGLGAFLIIFLFLIKKLMPSKLMMKVMSTLHAALFGYESALIDLIGKRGYKTHVFPKIIETISKIREESPDIAEVFNAKTPLEAMQKWMKVLTMINMVKGEARVIYKGTDNYEIHIPHCAMCNPIHDIIGDQEGICPMALIIASVSSIVGTQEVPSLSYSQFYPKGTITSMKMVKE